MRQNHAAIQPPLGDHCPHSSKNSTKQTVPSKLSLTDSVWLRWWLPFGLPFIPKSSDHPSPIPSQPPPHCHSRAIEQARAAARRGRTTPNIGHPSTLLHIGPTLVKTVHNNYTTTYTTSTQQPTQQPTQQVTFVDRGGQTSK